MLAELASDLLDKVKTIGALTDSTALTIGGKPQDPDLTKIPLPAAWVVLRKEEKDTTPYGHTDPSGVVDELTIAAIWTVTVMVPYATDADMLDVQFPLLESVRKAIHNTDSPSGFKWSYMGQRIALVYTNRLAYEQTYHVNLATSS
jgi:hypothetical protein